MDCDTYLEDRQLAWGKTNKKVEGVGKAGRGDNGLNIW